MFWQYVRSNCLEVKRIMLLQNRTQSKTLCLSRNYQDFFTSKVSYDILTYHNEIANIMSIYKYL